MDESQFSALEERVRKALGSPSKINFDEWRNRHADAVAYLNPVVTELHVRRRRQMQRIILFAATTAAAVCALIGLSHLGTNTTGASAFAQTVDQIQKAKNVTWKWTVYMHVGSKDGKTTWLKTETREKAYKSPGLYRETYLDDKGQVREVEITDAVHKKRINIFPGTKEATISDIVTDWDTRGPFEWVKKELETANLQWVETRNTHSGEVNVFRHAYRDQSNGRDWSDDFWIDQKTKRLVEAHSPGADIYDPDKDPARNIPPGKAWSTTCPASVNHDIDFDASVDDSLFPLEPPAGYAIKTQRRSQVTEKDMVDYLGVLAGFSHQTFPEQVFPFDISNDRVNKAWAKPKSDRSAAEQKLVETKDYYIGKFQRMPIGLFIEDHAVANSFRYLGKGVKLGDKAAIVCWYRLKDANDPNAYRVVFGDLSVKDVAARDLPLPVGQ